MQWFFRSAQRGDVDAIVQLVESAYRGDSSRAGWTTEADLLDGQRTDQEEVTGVIALPSAQMLLAHDAQELLGCLLVRKQDNATSHLGMFAVKPTLQSRGLGSALLARAEALARERQGAERAEMTVIEQRLDLIAWYERRGYRATGQTEPFPYGNSRFGLPRRDDLRFVVLAKRL